MDKEKQKPRLPEEDAVQKLRDSFRTRRDSLRPSEELLKIIDRAKKESEVPSEKKIARTPHENLDRP